MWTERTDQSLNYEGEHTISFFNNYKTYLTN